MARENITDYKGTAIGPIHLKARTRQVVGTT